jgi:hypothetical protein
VADVPNAPGGEEASEPLGPVGPGRGGRARPERDRGASAASPTLGGPVAAGTAVPFVRKGKTMNLESVSLTSVSLTELETVEGGGHHKLSGWSLPGAPSPPGGGFGGIDQTPAGDVQSDNVQKA